MAKATLRSPLGHLGPLVREAGLLGAPVLERRPEARTALRSCPDWGRSTAAIAAVLKASSGSLVARQDLQDRLGRA